MAKITLYLKDAQIRSEVSGILTSVMVGVEVKLVCDENWEDLSKTLICRAGDIAKTTFVKDNRAVVAHETMVAGKWLELGVEGRNDDGSVVIPTLWERCCIVLPGADSSADQTVDPTLPIWMQLQKRVESLEVPHAPSDIGALPTPLAAEVGQYLRVAGVNSIGAVTQVEAVDAPKQNDDAVKTVNGIAPDENGNVQIPVSGGNVDQEQITIAINTALAQAKASGEFDGKDGKDYVLTEADKQEIAQEAAELVEVPDVDIPTTLPNPNALTFTGAATGTYDGSAPLTVNIPAGGGGTGGGSSGTWELIGEVTSDGAGNSSGIYVPIDFTQYKEVFIEAWIAAGAINRVLMSSNTAWYSGQVLNTNSTTANEYGSINNPRNENVMAQTIIHNICGELKPFSSWCTGYANGGKSVLQVSHARDTYLATSYSYIRMDTHNNGAVAEGNWLKVWGCK